MRKKNDVVSAEIIPLSLAEKIAGAQESSTIAIARMIEELVQKILSGPSAELEPFFGTAEVSYEIKRRQTVQEQKKFTFYFEDWGCMVCGTREACHRVCGMCERCHYRVLMRLRRSLRKREPATDSTRPGFTDTVKLAREALAPSLEIPQTAAHLELKRAATSAKQRRAQETLWADPKFRARMRDARNRKLPAR